MDRFGLSGSGGLPPAGLIKLRDLPHNIWNVDTLYILCPDAARARRLGELAETEGWGELVTVHEDRREVDSALGGGRRAQAVVSIWWD